MMRSFLTSGVLGSIRFGLSRAAVEASLGAPPSWDGAPGTIGSIPYSRDESPLWAYFDGAVTLSFADSDELAAINVFPDLIRAEHEVFRDWPTGFSRWGIGHFEWWLEQSGIPFSKSVSDGGSTTLCIPPATAALAAFPYEQGVLLPPPRRRVSALFRFPDEFALDEFLKN